MNDEERRKLQSHELHSARSTASIIAAVLVTAICLYFMFEAALKSLGQEVWIRSPGEWGDWLTHLPESANSLVLAAGSLVVLLMWIYFSSAILLFAASCAQALSDSGTELRSPLRRATPQPLSGAENFMQKSTPGHAS